VNLRCSTCALDVDPENLERQLHERLDSPRAGTCSSTTWSSCGRTAGACSDGCCTTVASSDPASDRRPAAERSTERSVTSWQVEGPDGCTTTMLWGSTRSAWRSSTSPSPRPSSTWQSLAASVAHFDADSRPRPGRSSRRSPAVHVWSVSSWREALRAVRHLVADREERGEWVPLTLGQGAVADP